jgi:hypothetical protein
MDGWIEIKECAYCKSELNPYRAVNTAPILFVEFCDGALPVSTNSTFSKCSKCGLVVQSPRMTDERIAQYYSSGLYRQTLGIGQEAMDADELRRAQDVAYFIRTHRVKPNSHADIGASRGYLLAEMNAKIQKGIDLNPSYGKYEQGTGQRQYDLITSIHVLEHTTDPIQEIAWYKSIASDKILIEVPGMECKGGPLRFAHLYYFPPTILANMMQDAGLSIVDIETEPNTRILAKI